MTFGTASPTEYLNGRNALLRGHCDEWFYHLTFT